MIDIGKEIEKVVKQRGITQSELARRIAVTPQAIRPMFDRTSIDTGVLMRISRALDYDFFDIYVNELGFNRAADKWDSPKYDI